MAQYEYCILTVFEDRGRAISGEFTRSGSVAVGGRWTTIFKDDTELLMVCRVRELDRLGAEGWSLVETRRWYDAGDTTRSGSTGYEMMLMRVVE